MKKRKLKLPSELKSRTISWNAIVGSIAAVWFSVQEAVPEIKGLLDPKWYVLFMVANALIGLWLRTRTDKPLDAYREASATAPGNKEAE